MAGNIVKWWKHKILGGYKQFSVLQECTTDSEELIYPVRAPSSCSAPPDLLLVSDRETVQLKQSVNIIPTLKGHHNNHHHSHHHHQQQQQQKDNHSKKALINKNNTENPLLDGSELHGKAGTDERMRLEEFTCDVSVEGGKSSQPLQFSFTFYDLDGHHGKITKDDIAGIVYTIYESIGKSVVVPHCGSKTINVRLTVSPEGKTKPSGKLKKINTTSLGAGGGGGDGIMRGASAAATTRQQSRRQHRYRPRKLIKSDEEEDDAESDSEKELNKKNGVGSGGPSTSKATATADVNQKFCYSDEGRPSAQSSQQPSTSCKFQQLPTSENIYESVGNLKFNLKEARKDDSMLECKECVQSTLTAVQHQQHHQHQQFQQSKHILTRAKLLRRARKHKYQEKCFETRQRSLSVGNESSWKMRTAAAAAATRNAIEATTGDDDKPIARTTTTTTTTTTTDDIDGIQEPITSECWNNALKRNDLIDIIRASMEKNRLCFQSNGKPQRNGISPVRHRQRSRIISKIVNETDTTTYHQHHQSQQQQTSHHIPIYHQQMAINPALLAPHPKTNLCGYDSFLHATICTSSSANNSPHSAPPVPNHPQMTSAATTANAPPPNKTLVNNHSNNNIKQLQQHQHRMNKISRNTAGYHSQQNSPQFHSNLMGQQQKLNTSLLNSLNPQLSAEGKLVRTIDNVEKWLNEKEHLKSTSKYDESKFKKDEKNYDNLLYSKLNEKFLDVNGSQQAAPKKIMNNNNNNHHHHHQNISNKENNRRQHHYNHYQRHSRHSVANRNASAPISAADNNDTETTLIASSDRLTNISKFITMIPINIDDPIECENLIHPTSDDDTLPPTTPPPPPQVINDDGLKSGGGEDSASASNNGNNSTSSTVHRYVHEHIHHHYHHFENKDD